MLKLLLPLLIAVLTYTPVEKPSLQIAMIDVEVPQQVEYEIYEVTAYTAGFESTGKTPEHPEYGITASGVPVRENHTLACPPSMPFGTEIYIPFFNNTFVCEDRGGAITEGRLDVYMENLSDALEFGRRKLEVLVLDKP